MGPEHQGGPELAVASWRLSSAGQGRGYDAHVEGLPAFCRLFFAYRFSRFAWRCVFALCIGVQQLCIVVRILTR